MGPIGVWPGVESEGMSELCSESGVRVHQLMGDLVGDGVPTHCVCLSSRLASGIFYAQLKNVRRKERVYKNHPGNEWVNGR